MTVLCLNFRKRTGFISSKLYVGWIHQQAYDTLIASYRESGGLGAPEALEI